MLESLEDIQRVHPSEDDVLTSLVRLGISKAVAVIGHCDQVRFFKSLETDIMPSSAQTLRIFLVSE